MAQVIPKGWRELELSDFLIFTPRPTPKPEKKYLSLGIRSHCKGTFIREVESPEKVMMDTLYEVKKDDLIVNITFAWEGAVALVNKNDEGALVSHRFPTYVFNRDRAVPEYFRYLIPSKRFTYDLGVVSPGGAGRNRVLDREEFLNLKFVFPAVPEQKKIAAILVAWDRMIACYASIIEAKKKKSSAFRQKYLTGNTRLPGFTAKWREMRLRDVLNEHGGVSSGKEEVCSVSVHKGIINQCQHLGRVYAAADTSNYNLVKYGDIIYTKSPTGSFPFGIVKQSLLPQNVIVSPLYGVFTPASFALGTILDFYFESPVNANNYLKPIIHKGAKNTINITNKTFVSQALLLPCDPAEQKALAKIITSKRAEIDLLERIKEKYVLEKKGLMQKLLTGKIRVRV